MERKGTLYAQIQCTWERSHSVYRICLFPLAISNKGLPLTNPNPSFPFLTLFLSLFFALSHRVSTFFSFFFLSHAFLLS
ncbi:hypothetical protein VNO77_10801 [Canavalia gladiata]|uniref:Uncharacterized protein n=1 Tax=Canavalia gladiata TaxID=3824 RepID=A0AAN9MBC2_CANGL